MERKLDKWLAEEDSGSKVPVKPEDDIEAGKRLLQKMGWKGKGLGKEQHGREEPIIAQNKVDRAALGMEAELDWQMGKINERMKYLLETGVDSDVEFLVPINDHSDEKKLIKAHKFVLKNSSPIFASQIHFEESKNEVTNAPIEIKDAGIFASSFSAMLHFIYSDDSSLINNQNFVGVYLAAKKYLLNSLVQKCIELVKRTWNRSIQTMLDEENVFDMLKWAKFHKNAINTNTNNKLDDETILIQYSWEFIDEKIGDFGTAITLLTREEMAELLVRDTLKCGEMTLFNHLNNWAVKQCQNEGIMEPTGDQKRAKIAGLLYVIRFPLIPPMEFIKKILPTYILSEEEIAPMFLHYTTNVNTTPNSVPFSAKPRAIPPRKYYKLVEYTAKKFKR